ncbi:hypothetical protein CCP4SC76_7430021 [Gammaproteobacteria bacterium]
MIQSFNTGRCCQQCSARLTDQMKFCPQCGASITVTAEIRTPSPADMPTPPDFPLPPTRTPIQSFDRLVVPIQNSTPPTLPSSSESAAMSRFRAKLYVIIVVELFVGMIMLVGYRTYLRPHAPHASSKPAASAIQLKWTDQTTPHNLHDPNHQRPINTVNEVFVDGANQNNPQVL